MGKRIRVPAEWVQLTPEQQEFVELMMFSIPHRYRPYWAFCVPEGY